MSTAKLYNTSGKSLKSVTLPKEVFEVHAPDSLISQALHVYRTNQKQHAASAKTRGEVELTKAKWFRQKGTGRARHGAKSAPIFVGGGVAHGPKTDKPFLKKLNTKMRRRAIASLLTHHADEKTISLISGLDKLNPKTKELDTLLNTLKANKKTLLLVDKPTDSLKKAGKNLPYLTLTPTLLTNIYQLLNANSLIIDQDALKTLSAWLGGKKATKVAEEKTVSKSTTSK